VSFDGFRALPSCEPQSRSLRPILAAEVWFIAWSRGGRIRQASFRAFVLDKDPARGVPE
jgi:hypothetical protein